MKNYEKFSELVNSAKNILITSHISPDPDAVASVLLLGTTLRLNFSDKEVAMSLEEEPQRLESVGGYSEITFGPLLEQVSAVNPDILIMVDSGKFERLSRHSGADVKKMVSDNKTKVIIIDHHEPTDNDASDLYINSGYPAAVQEVYDLLFNGLNLKKPESYAQTAMLGLYSDSGGFAYVNDTHSETFKMADELVSNGANIEQINQWLHQYSDEDIVILSELTANSTPAGDHTYSFLKDEFVNNWLKEGKSPEELHEGASIFINDFIRNIGNRKWGFVVYKNTLYGADYYSCSFRAIDGTKDVSLIAAKLNGGGHKGSAGSKFTANSLAEALEKVKQAISAS